MDVFDVDQINRLIANRRSIYPRAFADEPVEDSVINQMLENANWAPTHKLTEPWRFVVFKGDGLKRLAQFQSELYERVAGQNGTFENIVFEKLKKNPLKCSHVIAIGLNRNKKGKVPEIEEVAAVAAAVQNMQLTATAYGVGCYWGTGGVTYMEDAKSFFDLEPEDTLMGFLFIGKPRIEWPEGRRKPVGQKVKWITK